MFGRHSLMLWGCLACSSGVAAQAAEPAGIAFAGDLQAIDRAVLEAAQSPLPTLGMRAGAPARMPAAPSPHGVVSAGYSASMQARFEDEPLDDRSKPSFLSRLRPKWLGGGDASADEPTRDPFVAASQAPITQVGAASRKRDEGLQRIPAYAPPVGSPAMANSVTQTTRRSPAGPSAAKPPRDASGLALRSESGPRRGLFSSWFGGGDVEAPTPTPAPRATVRTPQPARKARPEAALAATPRPAAARAPQPSTPAQRSAPRPAALSAPQADGGVVVVSDDAPRTKRSNVVVASPIAPEAAPPVARVAQASPRVVAVSPELGMPTVTAAPKRAPASPAPMVNPFAETTSPSAAGPRLVASPPPAVATPAPPRTLATASGSARSLATPVAAAPVRPLTPYVTTTPRPATPAPTAPSPRSRELLAEAHQLAATAAGIDDFSAVLKRCRYVLAIDASAEAVGYANQLSSWALCKRGEALEDAGRLAEAEADYHDALRGESECWRAEHALGVIAARAGDADGALRRFNRTLDLNPEFAKAYSNRAALAVQKGDYQAALADYTRAIEINPDLEPAHTGRGRVCHMLGMLEEGLRHLDAAELLAPDDAMIATGRGDLLVDLGRYGEARDAYRRAIELRPDGSAAHRNLSWMLATCPVAEFRDGNAALDHAERAEKLAGAADDLTLDTKAAALAALGRYEEAAKVQQEAVERAPEGDTAAYRERLALYQQGSAFTAPPVRQSSYVR